MADQTLRDDPRFPAAPDAHGQAALLLVESLLHALIARSLIGQREAMEIVTVALEVKVDVADEMGDSAETMRRSLGLLEAIRASLSYDLPDDGPPALRII